MSNEFDMPEALNSGRDAFSEIDDTRTLIQNQRLEIDNRLADIVGTISKSGIRGGFNVDDIVSLGTIPSAVDSIPSTQSKTIYLTNTQQVAANLTSPSNIGFVAVKGVSIPISSGVIFTINGPFESSGLALADIFSGSGSYAFGKTVRLIGAGTPESVVTAPVGSAFLRNNGGAGTAMYLKESGTGNTGWKSVLTAGSFANPTASVGLTAVNGSATTVMRSDAAPALDVGIVPTWTGEHTFTSNIALSGRLNVNGATDATNFGVNVLNSHIAATGTYSLLAYGVGVPGAANNEYVGVSHTGTEGRISVDRNGTGSYRPLIIQTGGSTAITVGIDQSVTLADELIVNGVTTLYNIVQYDSASDFFLMNVNTGDVALSTNAGSIRLEPTGGGVDVTGAFSVTGTGNISGNTDVGGRLNVNGATDATNFGVNVLNSHIAATGTYSLLAYGVGVPGAANNEYVGVSHTGTEGRISVDRNGTGSHRPLIIQTGGSTAITVATNQGVQLASTLGVTGAITGSSTLLVSGRSGFGGSTVQAYVSMRIGNNAVSTQDGGLSQYGLIVDPLAGTDASASHYAILAKARSNGSTGDLIGVIIDAGVTTGGTVSSNYGLKIENQTVGSNNWAIKTGTGLVDFGENVLVAGTLGVTGVTTLSDDLIVDGITTVKNIIQYDDPSDFFLMNVNTGDVALSTNAGNIRLEPTGGITLVQGNLALQSQTVPASSSDTGTEGEVTWDSSYVYVCVGTNTWKRTAISTF